MKRFVYKQANCHLVLENWPKKQFWYLISDYLSCSYWYFAHGEKWVAFGWVDFDLNMDFKQVDFESSLIRPSCFDAKKFEERMWWFFEKEWILVRPHRQQESHKLCLRKKEKAETKRTKGFV